jgi:hypothetical protein
MTSEQARQVLFLYRPGSGDDTDPEITDALRTLSQDVELRKWYEEHAAFQAAMRRGLRNIALPPTLKAKILSSRPIPLPTPRRSPAAVWLAMAAALTLALGWFLFVSRGRVPDRFADFQSRMVSTVLREYRMDVITSDLKQLNRFLANQGAPTNYALPQGLTRLLLTGGARLNWRSQPVSMICFDRGDRQMLFLFVMNRSVVPDPPPETPMVSEQHKLTTVAWRQNNQVYLLAGPAETDFVRKYL